MRNSWRLAALLLTGCLMLCTLTACVKEVERTPEGPGGLPRGIPQEPGDTSTVIPDDEKDLPVYPGAVRTGPGTYETEDSLGAVKDHYSELFRLSPEIRGNFNEVTAFVMPDLEVLLFAVDDDGGTQIRFVRE